MAFSPRFALSPPADGERSQTSHEFTYAFDLAGNLIGMTAGFAAALGHEPHSLQMPNLRDLLDVDSWRRSHDDVLSLLGGGGNGALQLTVLSQDGHPRRMQVSRRLLFERGAPVAIQDHGHWIEEPSENALTARPESGQFTDQLKDLHRLCTTSYATFEEALQEHLQAGCRIFGLPVGLILQVEGMRAHIRASCGRPDFPAGAVIPLARTRVQSLENRLKTISASNAASAAGDLLPWFQNYLSTPIWLGAELYATLSFSSLYNASHASSSGDRELIELLARGIARLILEHRIQSERDHRRNLEENRNRVLEMIADSEGIDPILSEICRSVEEQRPGAICSVLSLKDRVLSWTAANSFPPEALGRFRPLRLDTGDELISAPLLWDNLRTCPLWAGGAHLAAQMGIVACRSAPILSRTGKPLGIVALHFPDGDAHQQYSHLLQTACRLAARALEQRELSERLEFQARHDSLTGLPNRSHFMELLNEALRDAGERSGALAVLFIDLDRFKQINDILGHAMGDRLLREVGVRLKRLLTEDDLAGRMGGDEFIIVLARQPSENAAAKAAREFLDALRAPHQIEDNELFVTASIGVAIYPRHGANAAELLRNADLAMYHVKNNGKNEVEVFRAEDHSGRLERLRLENSLRRALEHHEFELLYQPLVGWNGIVEGVEALLTWRHPVYGTISPKQFIPIAEETGLIIDIGGWVIRRACLEAAGWHKAGYAVRISVNVSALQFERRDFLETVAGALAISNLPPELLELELTESYIMKDLPQAAARLTVIRKLGVSIAIDDFGTGYSSLSYLSKLPVDSLKIDQSFLRNLQGPEGSLAVIQSIVRMAHSMNLKVVAEGVETRAELDLVRVLGCDRVQGHVYGAARSREHIEKLLATRDSLAPLDS